MTILKKLFAGIVCAMVCANAFAASIKTNMVEKTIQQLTEQNPQKVADIEKGVKQVARLWNETDGTQEEFNRFCIDNFIADDATKEKTFLKISEYLEVLFGNYNEMSLGLQRNLHLNTGELLNIDKTFGAYNPQAHLTDDLYANKVAFIIALNFPELSLKEKENLGSNRLAWAYARLGDIFTQRIPASIQQHVADILAKADIYISDYNIFMGAIVNDKGKTLFPSDMKLLCHWNLRDEIKANYSKGKEGLEKQRAIYTVMQRVVDQTIPTQVINSGKYQWNPGKNTLSDNGKTVAVTPEDTMRYQKLLDNFHAEQLIDKITGDTYIDRNFNDDMEIAVEDAENLFRQYVSAPEMKELGKLISKRLGRKLEGFDIWYDGFKTRSTINEDELSKITTGLYPTAEDLNKDLPNILQKLGFTPERANYLAEKITVDAARGSGHAWGAQKKGQQAHLRTRIPDGGLDYKGYNIAIHEFGHNVEQTISLYDVDYYMLNGVPNTAFTEALAFVFQKKDLQLLGIEQNDADKAKADVLDSAWSMLEICGVSLYDISVWKWMYAHPNATASELKVAAIQIAKDIWNQYYAPIFGVKDQTVLAIYSHSISYPLYLSAYAFGQIIQFQLENYFEGKDFANEVTRIYKLGTLTPNEWMRQATNSDLSVQPMIDATRKALK